MFPQNSAGFNGSSADQEAFRKLFATLAVQNPQLAQQALTSRYLQQVQQHQQLQQLQQYQQLIQQLMVQPQNTSQVSASSTTNEAQRHAALEVQNRILQQQHQNALLSTSSAFSMPTNLLGQFEPPRRPSLLSNLDQQRPKLSTMLHPDALHVDTNNLSGGNIEPSPIPNAGSPEELERPEWLPDKRKHSERLEQIESEKKRTQSVINTLKKREDTLKEIQERQDDGHEEEVVDEKMKDLSLAQKIYIQTRATVEGSHVKSSLEEPLFLEPDEVDGMEDLMLSHDAFQPLLLDKLRRHAANCDQINKNYIDQYNEALIAWGQKIEKWQERPIKKKQEQARRAIYEEIFPDLKTSHERQVRKERCMQRADNIPLYLLLTETNQSEEENKVRANALTVPIFSTRANPDFYRNENNAVFDETTLYKKRIDEFKSAWTEEEKQTFHAKFGLYGKNFAAIKCFLEKKTVKDCVLWYYLSKNTMNYKGAFKKNKRKNTKVYKPPMMPKDEELSQIAPQLAESKTSGLSAAIDSKCCLCNMKINLTNSSQARVLTRSLYDTYGVDARDTDVKVCSRCQAEVNRNRNSQKCLTRSCDQNKRKSKTLRSLPAKWKTCDERIKRFVAQHFGFPREMTKCCPPCFKKINRKIDQAVAGEIEDEILDWEKDASLKWPKPELDALDRLVQDHGRNWEVVCTYLCGRTAEECKIQWESRNGTDGSQSLRSLKDEDEEQEEEKRDEDDGEAADQEIVDEESTLDVPESISMSTEQMFDKVKEEPCDSNDDRASVELEPANVHSILGSANNTLISPSPAQLSSGNEALKDPTQRTESSGSSDDVVVLEERDGRMISKGKSDERNNLQKGGSITQGTPLRQPLSNQETSNELNQATPIPISQEAQFAINNAQSQSNSFINSALASSLPPGMANEVLQQLALHQLQMRQQQLQQAAQQQQQQLSQPQPLNTSLLQQPQPQQQSIPQHLQQAFLVNSSNSPQQQPQQQLSQQEEILKALLSQAGGQEMVQAYRRFSTYMNEIQQLEQYQQQIQGHAMQDVNLLGQLAQIVAQIQEKKALAQQEEARLIQIVQAMQPRNALQQQQSQPQAQISRNQLQQDQSRFSMSAEATFNLTKERLQRTYQNVVDKQKLCEEAQAKMRLCQDAQATYEKRMSSLQTEIQKTQASIDAYQKLNKHSRQAAYRAELVKQQNELRDAACSREQAGHQMRAAHAHFQARQTQLFEAQQELQLAQQLCQEASNRCQQRPQNPPSTSQVAMSIANTQHFTQQAATTEDFNNPRSFQQPNTTQSLSISQLMAQQAAANLAAAQPVVSIGPPVVGGGAALAGNEEGKDGEDLRKAEADVLNSQHQLLQAREAEKSMMQKIEELRRALTLTFANGAQFSFNPALQTQIQSANEEIQRLSKRTAEAQKSLEQAEARRSQIKDALAATRAGSNTAVRVAEEREREAVAHYERLRSKGAKKDFGDQVAVSSAGRTMSPALLMATSSGGFPVVPATSPVAGSSKANVSPAIGINRPVMAGGSLSSGRSAVAVSTDENRALLERVVHEEVSSVHANPSESQRAVRKSGIGTCVLPQVETHKQLPSQIQRRTASPLNIVVPSRPGSAQLPLAQNSPSLGTLSANSLLLHGQPGRFHPATNMTSERPPSQHLPSQSSISALDLSEANAREDTPPAYEPLSPEATGGQDPLRPIRPPTAISSGPTKEKFSVLDFDDDESSNEITFPGCDQNVPPGPPPPPPPFMIGAMGAVAPINEQSFEPLSDDDS